MTFWHSGSESKKGSLTGQACGLLLILPIHSTGPGGPDRGSGQGLLLPEPGSSQGLPTPLQQSQSPRQGVLQPGATAPLAAS